MPDQPQKATRLGSFWSGTITFGLVSIRVELYPANRARQAALRLIDRQGTPLRRQYFCGLENKPLTRDELARGFEVEPGRYVVISDEELEAIEPRKSREIDLHGFVALADLDPVYFQRAYFLAPADEATKAYRLLAAIMERHGRAGMATFVMRGREQIVAIIAEAGILRAETLHFAEEIRTPADLGLQPLAPAPPAKLKQLRQEIKKLFRKKLAPELLSDHYAQRLLDLAQQKIKAGQEVAAPARAQEAESAGAEIIDLMAILKKRFRPPRSKTSLQKRPAPERGPATKAAAHAADTKTALYQQARQLRIAGRAKMNKKELLRAIQKVSQAVVNK